MTAKAESIRSVRSARGPLTIADLFAADPRRFEAHSLKLDDLLLDWSKTDVDEALLSELQRLVEAVDLPANIRDMYAGKVMNPTEDRAVLHTALRAPRAAEVLVDGVNVMPQVHDVLDRMAIFADAIRSGSTRGATGKPITDVINIGIGGSDLGPAMVTLALGPYHDGPRTHYVSNIDGAHIADTLKLCDPETTLIIVASKTFTTIETMTNAATARTWIADALGEAAVGRHFAALSTALDKVAAFGIEADRVFGFWDWVGGRYSVWSAIGLPVMLAVGPEAFRQFLDGAHAMDTHFRNAAPGQNLPIMLGLLGWYHRVVVECPTRAIIAYDQRLSRLAAYLQQLDMESNGKGVRKDGSPVTGATGPIVWGEPGTNGQHAFFQLLHQGTDVIPVEFIIAAEGHEAGLTHQHDILVANCLAQSEALMRGRTLDEARAQLLAKGMSEEEADALAPHRVFPGNRPSITIVHNKLTPYTLGRLIALYEHRVFVESVLFGINAFDQWGVELGKELATGLLPAVQGRAQPDQAGTAGLLAHMAAVKSGS